MSGGRRVRAASVLPRYSPPCLFQGHLSTKSNAFCTDSSSLRLSTLHLVKNHMAVHYNKILSAKAVVDCSVPLSMSASIKYADQQRREKLRKELARGEREMKISKRANSKISSKSLFNILQKPSEERLVEGDVFIAEVNEASSFPKLPVTSSEKFHLTPPNASKMLTSRPEKNSSFTPPSVDSAISGPRKAGSGTPSGRESRSTCPNPRYSQLVIPKAPKGDLLDQHSELFSDGHLPFTPRTLKTEAKSFLSQYRYYTPARRKKGFTDQCSEAETQTESSSFKSDCNTVEIKKFPDSEVNVKQGHGFLQEETSDGAFQHSSSSSTNGLLLACHIIERCDPLFRSDFCCCYFLSRAVCQYSLQLPTERKVYSDEEELLYLSFIEDITEDILKLGLFSNRFLEQLFERHIRQNKHHLEEEKMRHLVHVLKLDLGCENSVKPDDIAMLSLLDSESAAKPREKEVKAEPSAVTHLERQEYQHALHMLLSAPEEEELPAPASGFFMPIPKSKSPEGVTIQQVSEDSSSLPASFWDEKISSASDILTDPETYVSVIEGDSDTEKPEPSAELCCVSAALSQPHQLCGTSSDLVCSALRITDMTLQD
ncbi:spermatogenesis-associated protein 7 [Erinaceus europaeus]|uniref:Spermatogenesis-associated protein 7 n=1 Tax=Erinaceus europaeus TaxID=9365 RepID=A0ABM3WVP4_ERIEU|nr:spermatogenesis-associated protein 7 [Erinaceus europaeus]